MGKSIAAEINLSNQGNETNSENVKFDVYLDEVDSDVKEKTADINSQEMKLYVSTSVQGGGYLNNPVVEFVNTSFRLKNNPEETKFKLDSVIQSEKGITVGVPIIARNDESYNLSLLDMQSKIRLTGEYVDADGNVTDIDTTKTVKITWTVDKLTEEDSIFSQEVITNKMYNIDGVNKRVVQILVKSQIRDNKAPVKSTQIEIANPGIGFTPEEVKVASYGTKATDGKTSAEFQDSSWQYNKEKGKTYISISNDPSEENIVSWTKNAQDVFVVTYVYDGDAVVTPFISNAKSTIDIYGRTEDPIEKTNKLTLEELVEVGDIVKLESSVTENIYKGKMYIGEDTNYQTTSKIYVPYSKIASGIAFEETADEIAEGVSTCYTTTKINKAQAQKVLGEEGTIIVYNSEDATTPVQEISLSEETEGDYYTISYEGDISKIIIAMSPVQLEGIIEIINEKVIKVTNTEAVAELTELKSNTGLTVKTETGVTNSTIVNTSNVSTAKLEEPKTTFDISLDKTSLSALSENDLRITAELISKDESNKLFNNPILKIELPAEVTEASIENISDVVGNDELELKSYKVEANEVGNKVIAIEMQGEQTEYSSNSSTITVDLKIKTNEFMADKNVEIKATCINDAEAVKSKETVKLISKSGLVTKNTLTVGANTIQEVNNNNLNATISESTNVSISSAIINNFEENISNINIVGKIPTGMILTSAISSNTEGIVISYSEEENATTAANTWETEVTDYSKIKSLKISLNEMAKAGLIDLKYDLNVNLEGIETTTTLTNDLSVNYIVNEQVKEEKIGFTLNVVEEGTETQNLEEPETQNEQPTIIITPKATIDTLYEGQIITYEIKVKNTTKENLTDVILDYAIPEGAVLTELTYAQGTDITFTDNDTIKNKEWEIETLSPNQTISRKITLKIKQGTTEIVNNVSLKDSENNVIVEVKSNPIMTNEGIVSARLSRRDNMEISLTNGSTIEYIVIIRNNTETAINNLKITSQVPEKTLWAYDSEYNQNWEYNDDSKKLQYTIDTLDAGETKHIRFEVEVDDINEDSCEATIENTAIVSLETGESFETNVYTSNVLVPRWNIHMTSEHNSELKEGDSVKYIIKVKNDGKRAANVYVEDILPEEIQISKLTYYTDEKYKVEDTISNQEIGVSYPVEIGETLTIIIEGVTYDLGDNTPSKQVSNVAKIHLGNGEYLESETIVNTITNDTKGQTGNTGDNEDLEDEENNTNPEEPNEDGKYSISGLAWIDENKNGVRDNQEKTLELLEVILLDNKGNEVAKTITSVAGTYKFNNLNKGEYIVAFSYDIEKYVVAKYQIEDANETNNSDTISKVIKLGDENKTVAVTDTIKLNDRNITNIDIGLVENPEFDLTLNKYISKVVVTNEEGTATYEYEDTELAKVEIGAKHISGSVLLVEYEIKISNEGDVNGYVTDIIDYLPKELQFNSEMNTEWYLGTDNYLHYMALDPQAIEPGKTQTVKLVLTKTLKSNSTGTIENTAEILESANLETIKDIDSVAGNQKAEEDDIGKASLIVSIRTGSPAMYIGIVIGSMLVLGLGIYIINKKILRVKI